MTLDKEPWSMPASLGSNDVSSSYNDAASTATETLASATLSSTIAGTNDTASDSEFFYQNGEVIEQKWHIAFIFIAYVIAYIGAYAAIRLLEHGLWRSKQEEANASSFISKHPKFFTSLIIASCTIWSMHFVGMQAVQLMHVPMCYDTIQTVGSLLLSIAGVWAGVNVASNDIFAGADRIEKLKQLLQNDPYVTSKLNRAKATQHIHMVALLYRLQWIAAGSLLAALGALSMHYVGMHAMKGPFIRQWNIGYLAGSVVLGMVVCFAGFWILFRPLHWKVEKSWYRYTSAGIIALAVCCLHFLGMMSVTYIADHTFDESAFQFCAMRQLWGWKTDQLAVVCSALVVPFVAFLVEHTISSELRMTYRQLMDINLSRSGFLQSQQMRNSSVASMTSTRPRTSGAVHVTGLDDVGSEHSHSSMNSSGKKKSRRLGYARKQKKLARTSLSERNRAWNSAYNSEEQAVSDLGANSGPGSGSVQRQSDFSALSHDDDGNTSMGEESSYDVENQTYASAWGQVPSLLPMPEEEKEETPSEGDGAQSQSNTLQTENSSSFGDDPQGSLSGTHSTPADADTSLPSGSCSSSQSRPDPVEVDEFLDHLEKSLEVFKENGQSLESFVGANCGSTTPNSTTLLHWDPAVEEEPQYKVATESA